MGPFAASPGPDPITALVGAFVLSQLVAWTYGRTFRGFSYSRSFVHSLILGALVTAIVIRAIGDSLALGLGVLGALAIIRFRTQIRDPRDIIFLFCALALGIACGAGAFSMAIAGTAIFCLVAFYLYASPFASMQVTEALVRFHLGEDADQHAIEEVLHECCSAFELASVRDALDGVGQELSYEVRLRDPAYHRELQRRLEALPDVGYVAVILHHATVEV